MTKFLSMVISTGCSLLLAIVPAVLIYLLWDIELFAQLSKSGIDLPIYWQSVMSWQWYSVWLATTLYFFIAWASIYYLRCAFIKFSSGEFINLNSSKNIRRFSVLLFIQAVTKPLLIAIFSLLLSANHPEGQKMLSLSLGSNEIRWIALAAVFWVISSLMFEAQRIQSENEQFV